MYFYFEEIAATRVGFQRAATLTGYAGIASVSSYGGFDGLSAEVASVLALDPYSGPLFLFRSKRGGLI